MMTSQGVDGTVDKAGRILPDSNQRVKNIPNKCRRFLNNIYVYYYVGDY